MRKILSNISREEIESCKNYVTQNDIFLVIHSSYLINIASLKDSEYKMNTALDDLNTSVQMGGIGAIFHVGKSIDLPINEALDNMKQFISTVLSKMNSDTLFILETGAGCGTELCTNLYDLGEFYQRFSEIEKEKIKFCIDTCHVFSAGYDLSTKETALAFIEVVEETLSWDKVALIHLNDSKRECNCGVDRHENLCKGFIGSESEEGFQVLVHFCYHKKIPLILETPVAPNSREQEIELIKKWIK